MNDEEIDLFCVTDHASACAEMLELFATRLRTGTCPEDFAREVELVGIIMSRRT